MIAFEMNVGLDVGSRRDALRLLDVVRALALFDWELLESVTFPRSGSSEPTVWMLVRTEPAKLPAQVHLLAAALQQDCIAVLYRDGTGDLFGPDAAKWGQFDPVFFQRP